MIFVAQMGMYLKSLLAVTLRPVGAVVAKLRRKGYLPRPLSWMGLLGISLADT